MPTTSNRALIVPDTGSLVGVWGEQAVNPDFIALDGIVSGVQSISLTNVNVSLTCATGVIAAAAGPNQSDNAIIKFTGTLTGNVTVLFPVPGFWVVSNQCTGNFYVQVRAAGTGNLIGLPPGKAVHIWNDGTNADYANMPDVGSFLDLCTNTTPKWMTACSVLPYLLCDGAIYSTSVYPQLFALLGTTFGGNGITTFGVPDTQSRVRVAIATAGPARITFPVAGFTATTWGQAGGSQLAQAHTHTNVLTDPGHNHNVKASPGTAGVNLSSIGNTALDRIGTTEMATTGISLVVGTALVNGTSTIMSGASGNIPPTIVHGLTFIKT